MAEKKPFNTTIDEEVLNSFKEKCKNQKLNMNEVLEKFMLSFVEGNVLIESEIKLKYKKSEEK